jgi:protein-S-isoprenylcysteine O-methyltransferase Ste14
MTQLPPGLLRAALLRFAGAVVVLGLLFFGTAGTFRYAQAWLYMVTLLVPMFFVLIYLLRRDPQLLERRFRAREQRQGQQAIVIVATLLMLSACVIPGLSVRFGWPMVPPSISVAADGVVLLGYILFFLVLRTNSYAARTVEVETGQQVITTGPYRYVRHPMYVAVIVMYLFTPLALGSAWAVLPALLLPLLIAARIRDEERVLAEGLPGYREYQAATRARLIPGIW